MKQSYLFDRNNSSSRRASVEMAIANNGLEILNRELFQKAIAKTVIFRCLPNGIKVYYFDINDKILAGAFTIINNKFPIIGELIEEPLEID